jgi:hypothetical protein
MQTATIEVANVLGADRVEGGVVSGLAGVQAPRGGRLCRPRPRLRCGAAGGEKAADDGPALSPAAAVAPAFSRAERGAALTPFYYLACVLHSVCVQQKNPSPVSLWLFLSVVHPPSLAN